MFRHITRQEIQQHLAAKTPMTLVEALPEKYYRDGHLPGAIQLPHDQVRQLAAERLPDKSAFIVVYCANAPCQNSRIASQTLDALGYTNVAEYVEGKQDWVDAGLPLEKSPITQAA
ncbi:MAG: rhodanese-like domain-containing protein [Sulfurifustis sp.]